MSGEGRKTRWSGRKVLRRVLLHDFVQEETSLRQTLLIHLGRSVFRLLSFYL